MVACTGTSFSGCLAGWFHIVVVRSLLVYATQLVQQLSSQLEEKKLKSLYNVVDAIGLDGARQLLADTLQLEANGGLTIADGSRRRTPGGVFFYLLKACVGGAVLVRCRMPTHRRAERDWRAQAGFISSVQADLLAREAPAAPAAEEATAPRGRSTGRRCKRAGSQGGVARAAGNKRGWRRRHCEYHGTIQATWGCVAARCIASVVDPPPLPPTTALQVGFMCCGLWLLPLPRPCFACEHLFAKCVFHHLVVAAALFVGVVLQR